MAQTYLSGKLELLDPSQPHEFLVPAKKINEGEDVDFWLTTYAYTDLMTFVLQLNASMFPRKTGASPGYREWHLGDVAILYSEPVQNLRTLVEKLEKMIEDAPPDTGPRRFGNVSFRKWHQIVEERIDALLEEHLPQQVLAFKSRITTSDEEASARGELKHYLLGSFGSAQRLDFGTGHEVSFLAFLGCIWKLGGFNHEEHGDSWGTEERGIVIGVIEPYLRLIRRLILTYTLEPAGSHGVWGLDDHNFISYIFGSAQLSPAISSPSDITQEGSIPDAPRPSDVTRAPVIARHRETNMYFSAIGFIYDVKKGPFWEHSPILFDISGVTAGWAKINKGMIKMYNAEVLSKFPVVQHFPFGSLFRWKKDPKATPPSTSRHTASQPSRPVIAPPTATARPGPGTQAPWASGATPRANVLPGPKTSWTGQSGATGLPATRAPWAGATPGASPLPVGAAPSTAAPWARAGLPSRPGELKKVDERDS